MYAAGQGDGKDKGLNHLGHKGLLKRIIGGHWTLAPKLQKLAVDNEVEAYNLPQGIISQMFRKAAAKHKILLSKVGFYTFIDPRDEGGKVNKSTTESLVSVIEIEGEEMLCYQVPKIDVALIRSTYSDEAGNISFEEEAVLADATAMAFAAKNNGGKVIVQVKKIVPNNSLDPKLVKIPGNCVDYVLVCDDIENQHCQTFAEVQNYSYSGQERVSLSTTPPLPLGERKIIARRASMEIRPDSTVNLGIGIPEGVAAIMNEECLADKVTLTFEVGVVGGIPAGGLSFGASANPHAILDQSNLFDFYDGGGIDIACLGLAQCDSEGNINVSRFGNRIPGCGGFINITQNAKKVIFCGTFTSGGLEIAAEEGNLKIIKEGTVKKFIKSVEQITFSSGYAQQKNQPVLYITERCVFELLDDGLTLIEIAPGIDIEKDILQQMDFVPRISKNLCVMNQLIFFDRLMRLEIG